MTNTQPYKRFGDEKYKNWLKTAESLSILRIRMQDFIEKETETYHTALLANKPAENTCKSNCYFKNKKVNVNYLFIQIDIDRVVKFVNNELYSMLSSFSITM